METGDFDRLVAVAREMDEAATATGDVGLQAHAIVIGAVDPARSRTRRAGRRRPSGRRGARSPPSTRLGDERGLARAWSLLGLVHIDARAVRAGRGGVVRSAAEHAQRAGNRRDALESLAWVPLTVWAGPTPAEEGIRRCREILDRAQGDRKVMSSALFCAGRLRGRTSGASTRRGELLERARALLEEVALPVWLAGPLAQVAGWVELLAGEPAARRAGAAPRLRDAERDRRGVLAVDGRRDPGRGVYAPGPRTTRPRRFTRGQRASRRAPRTPTRTCSGAACGRSASRGRAKTTEALRLARECVGARRDHRLRSTSAGTR